MLQSGLKIRKRSFKMNKQTLTRAEFEPMTYRLTDEALPTDLTGPMLTFLNIFALLGGIKAIGPFR